MARPLAFAPLVLALAALAAGGCGYVDPDAVAAPPAPLAVAGDGAAGVVAAPRAGSVAGVLRGPAAGLIAENAARVIGGNTGNVIGGNTAGVIGGNTAGVIGGNTGNLIGNAGNLIGNAGNLIGGKRGNYRLAQAPAPLVDLAAPVAGVAVELFDAAGHRLAAGVTTDPAGRFRFEGVAAGGRALFVRGRYEQEGHAVELAAAVPAPMAGEALEVAVDPATTLVAKKMDALLGTHLIDAAELRPAELAALAESLAGLLDARAVVAAAILPAAEVAAAFDALAADHEGVGLRLRKATEEPAAGALADPAPAPTPRATGRVETLAGAQAGFADGAGAGARFAYPHGLALDEAGRLYVADYNNHRIRRVDPDGTTTTIAGDGRPGFEDGAAAAARFRHPRGLAWHRGALYVVDGGNLALRRLREADGAWTVDTLAGGPEVGPEAGFVGPCGVAVGTDGAAYVADTGGLRVRRVAPGHPPVTVCEFAAGGPGQLAGPWAVAVDGAGALLVADATSNAIRRFAPADGAADGRLVGGPFAGGGFVGLLDGDALAARFAYPAALATDGAGTLFVADTLNHAVRRVDGRGRVTTVAGGGAAGDADGVGAAAGFFRPSGIAVGPDGTVYVADTENHRIRRVRP